MAPQHPKIIIKRDRLKSLRAGHPWVFSRGIKSVSKNIINGSICAICDEGNRFLATGYYNQHSDIRLRILSWKDEDIHEAFFIRRIRALREAKEELLPPDTDSYRLVYGESDLLPGLIIDKYKDVFVMQLHTLGMDRFRELIVESLKKTFQPATIYERSDISIRLKEGLKTQPKQLLFGQDRKEVLIREYGIRFLVNFQEGQKTGFFLDQRENRKLLSRFCQKRRVLNCFAYTGGFSVYAALSGAREVTSVEISKPALDQAKKNFEINGLHVKEYQFIEADVFTRLQDLKKGEYDLIILDPPSFAKRKEQVKKAIKAYITINSKALEKLPLQGILVSSSCTTHVDEPTFIKILHQASVNARCMVKVLASTGQPLDHTYNLSFPEGRYLKFFILQKLYEM
ncbi:MAG: class I SAM-dependent rRNA methyltransferase [bacterium]